MAMIAVGQCPEAGTAPPLGLRRLARLERPEGACPNPPEPPAGYHELGSRRRCRPVAGVSVVTLAAVVVAPCLLLGQAPEVVEPGSNDLRASVGLMAERALE